MRATRRKSNTRNRRKKVQLSFYAEPEDCAALKALSARTGVPQQGYLRQGLALILQITDSTHLRAATARRRLQDLMKRYQNVEVDWLRLAKSSGR
jgi:hypothetical protein